MLGFNKKESPLSPEQIRLNEKILKTQQLVGEFSLSGEKLSARLFNGQGATQQDKKIIFSIDRSRADAFFNKYGEIWRGSSGEVVSGDAEEKSHDSVETTTHEETTEIPDSKQKTTDRIPTGEMSEIKGLEINFEEPQNPKAGLGKSLEDLEKHIDPKTGIIHTAEEVSKTSDLSKSINELAEQEKGKRLSEINKKLDTEQAANIFFYDKIREIGEAQSIKDLVKIEDDIWNKEWMAGYEDMSYRLQGSIEAAKRNLTHQEHLLRLDAEKAANEFFKNKILEIEAAKTEKELDKIEAELDTKDWGNVSDDWHKNTLEEILSSARTKLLSVDKEVGQTKTTGSVPEQIMEEGDSATGERTPDATNVGTFWEKLEGMGNEHRNTVGLTERAPGKVGAEEIPTPGTITKPKTEADRPNWFESGNPTQEDIENIAKRIAAGASTKYDLAIFPKFGDQIESEMRKIKLANSVPKPVPGESLPASDKTKITETQPKIKDPKIFLDKQPQTRKTLITMEMPGGNSLETLTVVELREIETRLKTKIAVLAKAVDEFKEKEWKDQKQEFKTRMQNAILDFQTVAVVLAERGEKVADNLYETKEGEAKKTETPQNESSTSVGLVGRIKTINEEIDNLLNDRDTVKPTETQNIQEKLDKKYHELGAVNSALKKLNETPGEVEEEPTENKEIAEMNDQEIVQSMQILIPESVSFSLKPEYLRVILQIKLSKLFEVLPENIFDIEKLLKNKTPGQIAEDLGAKKLFEQYKVTPDALSIRKLVYIAKFLRWMSPTEKEKQEKTVYEFTKGRVQGM